MPSCKNCSSVMVYKKALVLALGVIIFKPFFIRSLPVFFTLADDSEGSTGIRNSEAANTATIIGFML